MKLEELIYQKLINDSELAALLTTYAERPAVFELRAPMDTADGWERGQYPRIEYVTNRSEIPERRVGGSAEFTISVLLDGNVSPEDIESRLRALLDGAVFHPEDEPVTALRWARSDPFEATAENDDLIAGYTVTFDLLAFPSQATSSPDPIAGMNAWTKAKFPELQVDPEAWAPTDATPAVYWRLASMQQAQVTAAVVWFDVTIMGHVLAPTPAGRLPWVKKLTESLAKARRAVLDDESPLIFMTVSADSQADHLRTGQIRLLARYGVLKQDEATEPAEKLNKANITEI